MHCERCGGYIPAPVIDATGHADAERIAELERENCILYIAFIIMTAIAAVAVYLYDKAVTGGMP
jgi:type IV secretory pathway component VirB8